MDETPRDGTNRKYVGEIERMIAFGADLRRKMDDEARQIAKPAKRRSGIYRRRLAVPEPPDSRGE
jgi:hypothetical protein